MSGHAAWCPHRKRGSSWWAGPVFAVAVLAVLLSVSGHARAHGGGAAAAGLLPAGPAGGAQSAPAGPAWPAHKLYTPARWAAVWLTYSGLRATPCNVGAVLGWIRAEGSDPAWRNPLDTTRVVAVLGSHPVNSVGVQSYPTLAWGVRATRTTLYLHHHYDQVIAAFRRGDDAQAVADAVAASVWGTKPFTATCTTR